LTPSEAAERVVPSGADLRDAVRSLQHRLNTALTSRLNHYRHRLDSLVSRPALARPLDAIHLRERRLDELSLRLRGASQGLLRDRRSALETMAAKLESLSPLGVLGRGYSLTFRE